MSKVLQSHLESTGTDSWVNIQEPGHRSRWQSTDRNRHPFPGMGTATRPPSAGGPHSQTDAHSWVDIQEKDPVRLEVPSQDQTLSRPSPKQALPSLASEIRRDRAVPGRNGRKLPLHTPDGPSKHDVTFTQHCVQDREKKKQQQQQQQQRPLLFPKETFKRSPFTEAPSAVFRRRSEKGLQHRVFPGGHPSKY